MNNRKKAENKKEDSRAFGKFMAIVIISALVGGVIGFTASSWGQVQKSIAEALTEVLGVISPFAPFVMVTALLIWDILSEKNCRKLFAGWNGEDEETVERIERKLEHVLTMTMVSMVLIYFFFGASVYSMNEFSLKEIVAFVIALAGLVYAMVILTVIQKRVVNFEKEINPEKQGSVYDPKFRKKWLASCDENEKLQIYKASYKAYQATNITCEILWVVTVIGMMACDFGLLPMTCVVTIWLVMLVSYSLESLRITKHTSNL